VFETVTLLVTVTLVMTSTNATEVGTAEANGLERTVQLPTGKSVHVVVALHVGPDSRTRTVPVRIPATVVNGRGGLVADVDRSVCHRIAGDIGDVSGDRTVSKDRYRQGENPRTTSIASPNLRARMLTTPPPIADSHPL
jgi:hypothetical protein